MAGVGGRTLSPGVPPQQRGGQEARLGLGHEEHQQPQRAHPEEVLPGGSGVLQAVCAA